MVQIIVPSLGEKELGLAGASVRQGYVKVPDSWGEPFQQFPLVPIGIHPPENDQDFPIFRPNDLRAGDVPAKALELIVSRRPGLKVGVDVFAVVCWKVASETLGRRFRTDPVEVPLME